MRKINPRCCTIFNCDRRHGNICCADCGYKSHCKNPCMNGPERCGCAQTGKKKEAGRKPDKNITED